MFCSMTKCSVGAELNLVLMLAVEHTALKLTGFFFSKEKAFKILLESDVKIPPFNGFLSKCFRIRPHEASENN